MTSKLILLLYTDHVHPLLVRGSPDQQLVFLCLLYAILKRRFVVLLLHFLFLEETMDWLKNRIAQRFMIIGFVGGLLFLTIGIWLEFNKHHLPFALWAFPYLYRTEPMIFLLDLAPFVFGIMAGLLGSQYSLSATVARGKKEWETVFDSFSDLILITDARGVILRCNHAFVDRLNTTFLNVIGKPMTG